MKINLTLTDDQADAFTESLSHYFPGADRKEAAAAYLSGAVDALIASAARGESIIAPLRLVRFEQ